MYSSKNFVKFFTIKSKNDANLTKLNMFKVDRTIRNKIGAFEKISEDYSNKTWTIEVRSAAQGLLSLIHI